MTEGPPDPEIFATEEATSVYVEELKALLEARYPDDLPVRFHVELEPLPVVLGFEGEGAEASDEDELEGSSEDLAEEELATDDAPPEEAPPEEPDPDLMSDDAESPVRGYARTINHRFYF